MRYFIEYDLAGHPVGVWAQDDSGTLAGFDYAYASERPDLEAAARDLVDGMVDEGMDRLPPDFLDYWSGEARYGETTRSAVYETSAYRYPSEYAKDILDKLRRGETL